MGGGEQPLQDQKKEGTERDAEDKVVDVNPEDKATEDVANLSWNSGDTTPGYLAAKTTRETITPSYSIQLGLIHDYFRGEFFSMASIAAQYYPWDISVHLVTNFGGLIFYGKSINGGRSWQKERTWTIENQQGPMRDASVDIAVNRDFVFVVWAGASAQAPSLKRIYFKTSMDSGNSFSRNPNTENMAVGLGNQHWPKLACWRNRVYLIWAGNHSVHQNPQDDYLVFARSMNSGNTFTFFHLIHGVGGRWMDVASSTVVTPRQLPVISLVFGGFRGQYIRSIDDGATFEGSLPISASDGVGAHYPVVASYYDHTVHIAYQQQDRANPANSGIYYRRSNDSGANFQQPQKIAAWNSGPQIAVFENNVYISWIRSISSQVRNVMFRKSVDGGQNFGPERVLFSNASGGSGPIPGDGLAITAPRPYDI
jgi:hypothetical protein